MSEYTLLWPIGRGGMATVWEARYKLPGGGTLPVACKIVHDHVRQSDDGDKLFEREAEINLRLAARHPGIVPARHWFEVDGKLCLVMDLIEGCSLDKLTKDVRLPYSVLRRIAIRTLDTIAYMHDQDILHRDVSPSNILLSTRGDVLLSDFGLSKRIAGESAPSSDFRGKFAYAAPEVMRGEPFDARADLYSFGAMLYELLSGEPPTGDALGFGAIMRHHAEGIVSPLPDTLPADLRTLAMGLIAKDPADRVPQTAADARDQLDATEIGYPGDLARLVAPIHQRERTRLRKAHAHDKTTRRIVVTDALSASPEAGQFDTVKHPGPASRTSSRRSDEDDSGEPSAGDIPADGNCDDLDDDRDTKTARYSLAQLAQLAADAQPPRPTPRRRIRMLALVAVATAAALGYLARGLHDPRPANPAPTYPVPPNTTDSDDAADAIAVEPIDDHADDTPTGHDTATDDRTTGERPPGWRRHPLIKPANGRLHIAVPGDDGDASDNGV